MTEVEDPRPRNRRGKAAKEKALKEQKKAPHRPALEFTKAEHAMVEMLILAGVPQSEIRKALAAATEKEQIHDATFKKHFHKEIESGTARKLAFTMAKLFDNVAKGNQKAIEFSLTNVFAIDALGEKQREVLINWMEDRGGSSDDE